MIHPVHVLSCSVHVTDLKFAMDQCNSPKVVQKDFCIRETNSSEWFNLRLLWSVVHAICILA